MQLSIPSAILALLCDPAHAADVEASAWSELIPRLRRGALLGRLGVATCRIQERLPPPVRDQLNAALAVADRQQRVIANEVAGFNQLIRDLGIDPVVVPTRAGRRPVS